MSIGTWKMAGDVGHWFLLKGGGNFVSACGGEKFLELARLKEPDAGDAFCSWCLTKSQENPPESLHLQTYITWLESLRVGDSVKIRKDLVNVGITEDVYQFRGRTVELIEYVEPNSDPPVWIVCSGAKTFIAYPWEIEPV